MGISIFISCHIKKGISNFLPCHKENKTACSGTLPPFKAPQSSGNTAPGCFGGGALLTKHQ